MAPKLLKHEYLLSPMLWSDFEHFRISGSIIYRELFLSLTRCFRGTSSFQDQISKGTFSGSQYYCISSSEQWQSWFIINRGQIQKPEAEGPPAYQDCKPPFLQVVTEFSVVHVNWVQLNFTIDMSSLSIER